MTGVEVTTPRPSVAPRLPERGGASWVRRHRWLVLVLLAAVALRVVALVAIYPGIWFADSNSYIRTAATGTLALNRVGGYALVVAPFWHAGSAGALIAVQHVVGVAIVVALYALLIRRGVPRWLAVLGVVPAALDAYLIDIEHMVMSETVFHAALVAAIVVLLWSERPSPVAAGVAGLLVGYAGIVRSVALPLIAVFLVYLLARRVGWRRLVALVIGWAVVAGSYATVFDVQHGRFGFTASTGRFLYGKVAPFADCAKLGDIPASQRWLCPDPRHRMTTQGYMWRKASPIHGAGPEKDGEIFAFAARVVRHQPLAYARHVARDVLHYFEPGHRIGRNDYPVVPWLFPVDPRHWGYEGYRGPIRPGDAERRRTHSVVEPNRYVGAMVTRPRADAAASRFLHDYQRVAYTPGPLLAACLLVVVVALVLRRGAWRLRLDATLLAVLTLASLIVAEALSLFSYRYGLIAPILLPPAAALALAALLCGGSRAVEAGARAMTSRRQLRAARPLE